MAFPAFFDTCSLYGVVLSDLIIWLADGGAFRPLWSADIIEELRRNLVSNGLAPNVVEKRLTSMTRYFPDAMVEGYEHLVTGMRCDENDRHVLAAAVRSNAEVLVTFNLRDFPDESTSTFNIEVVHPDDFLLDQLDLFPGVVVRTLHHLSSTYDSPPLSVEELLQSLANAGVPRFAQDALRFL